MKGDTAKQGDITLNLPRTGFSRWSQIKPFLPVCRETWRAMSAEGRAPKAIRLTPRCTVYSNEECHRYFADPLGYKQPTA
ncbi:transcriptional regulator [Pandoraea capi]|nr:transcriptional regulator [Pandoraea sp. LA3]MDN4584569.1 transcriptional regulator [Pandoraea capi]